MKLELDFDNNTVTTEQGTISVPGLSEKKKAIFELLELEEIPTAELKEDINNLFSELGFTNVKV